MPKLEPLIIKYLEKNKKINKKDLVNYFCNKIEISEDKIIKRINKLIKQNKLIELKNNIYLFEKDNDELLSRLRKFNQKDLFLWTQITSLHPNNQLYQYRFELLCSIILSMQKSSFENKPNSREDFEEIINLFNKRFGNEFFMYEDWEPYSIFKSIPLIIDKDKYYFLTGPFENSYEQYQKYIRYFLNNSQKNKFQKINSKIIDSLLFQTRIIDKILMKEESKQKQDSIYVPSEKYFEEIKGLFITEKNDTFMTVNDFSSDLEEAKNQIFKFQLYTKTIIKLDENFYWIFPQEHLTSFYELINSFVTDKGLIELTEIFKKQLLLKSAEFFSKTEFEINIFNKEKKSLLENVDFCICVDQNKLFLIKCTNVSKDKDLSNEIKKAAKGLELLEKFIQDDGEYLLFNKGLSPLDELDLEIVKIIVHENTQVEYYASMPNITGNNLVISFSDYIALLDTFESSIDLFRFIRDDNELRDKIHTADYLDRIPYYLQNNLSYPIPSDQIDFIQIPAHEWSNHYYDKLYNLYVVNKKEKIELLYGKNFNKIKKISENIYEFIDTFSYRGGALIENSFLGDMIIQYPEIDGLSFESISSFSNFLSPLIYTNLEKMSGKLSNILTEKNRTYQKYIISLYPAELILKNKKFEFLKEYSDHLNEDNPLYFKTGVIHGNILKTAIIYDFNNFPKLFSSPNNEGERAIIKLYLDSLFSYLNIQNSDDTINSLIDEFIPIAKKGFSYDIITVINEKLKDYSSPIKDINSDIMKVNRELVQFIKGKDIKPGTYENESANEINGQVFNYLKSKIEEYICCLSFENIFFIYHQIELCEGKRTRHNLKLRIDSKKYIEYDLKEHDLKKANELSSISTSSKLILLHFLKISPNGTKKLTQTDWTYLLALMIVHQASSLIYDYIKHNIQENKIEITDLYELKDIKGNSTFDMRAFLESESQRKIEDAKDEFNLKKVFEKNIFQINEQFSKKLGFTFDDILNFLMILGKSNIDNKYNPMTLIELDKISEYVNCIDKKLSNEIIEKLVAFLSLSKSDLNEINLMPLTLSTHQKRPTLCPLVLIGDKILFGNELCIKSALFWTNQISSGILPYNDNNSEIERALKNYYDKIDNLLEDATIKKTKDILGEEKVIGNLKKYKAIGINKEGEIEGGEIDILAVNEKNKEIILLDAKHTIKNLKPHGNFKEFDKFFLSNHSYLTKLNKKEKFVNTPK
jgi:hypothetical protein